MSKIVVMERIWFIARTLFEVEAVVFDVSLDNGINNAHRIVLRNILVRVQQKKQPVVVNCTPKVRQKTFWGHFRESQGFVLCFTTGYKRGCAYFDTASRLYLADQIILQ